MVIILSVPVIKMTFHCTAFALPLRRKFMECSIINQGLSLLVKHLVIGQRQKAPNFLFSLVTTVVWFPLVSISYLQG